VKPLVRSFAVLACVAAASLLAGATPVSSQSAGPVNCDKCHGDRAFIERRRDAGRTDTAMFVPSAALRETAHGKLSCAECHVGYGDGYPHAAAVKVVPCRTCHEQAGKDWSASVHAPNATTTGDAPNCAGCHGTHLVYPSTDRRSTTHPLNVAETCGRCHADDRIIGTYFSTVAKTQARTAVAQYYQTVHGHALNAAGLIVSATCNDCHRAHKVLPADSPESSINRRNIPSTCGACHEGVSEVYDKSAHGVAQTRADTNSTGHSAPVCTDCHSAHGIVRADEPQWHVGVVEECGTCHEKLYETYLETYHGKVNRLGSSLAATCADCHTPHDMRLATDTASSVYVGKLVVTCQKCHAMANAQFVKFSPHADPRDRAKNPQLYWTWLFMNLLLMGVMGFFGIHTLLWLTRLSIDYARARRGAGQGNDKPGSSA
jgi:nitrate/TMAO reductase-like tetraheme cytochrome c subunit